MRLLNRTAGRLSRHRRGPLAGLAVLLLGLVISGSLYTAFSPARLLDPRAFPSGGSDMAGTASDVLRFLETLRAGGLLQTQTRSAMFKVQAVTRGQAEGPGWEFGFGGAVLVDPNATGTPQAPGTLQWNGAYGHKWFIDPANELTVVALTNTAFEGMIGRFTVDIRNAVYGV